MTDTTCNCEKCAIHNCEKSDNSIKSYFIKVLCIPKTGNDEDGYTYEIGNIASFDELKEKKLEILSSNQGDQFYSHISTYEITNTYHLAVVQKRTVRMM